MVPQFFFAMFTVLRSLTTCLGFGRLHVLGPAADRRFVRSSGRRPVLGPPAGPRGPAERQTTCLFFGPVRRPAVPGWSGRRSCCFFRLVSGRRPRAELQSGLQVMFPGVIAVTRVQNIVGSVMTITSSCFHLHLRALPGSGGGIGRLPSPKDIMFAAGPIH